MVLNVLKDLVPIRVGVLANDASIAQSRYSFDVSKCPELQRNVDDTNGDTLGARLKVLFPKQTHEMRDQYAEMFVRTFCPEQKAPAAPITIPSTVPTALLVEGPPTADGFVPPEMLGLASMTKHLSAELLKSRRKAAVIVPARNKERADIVVTTSDDGEYTPRNGNQTESGPTC